MTEKTDAATDSECHVDAVRWWVAENAAKFGQWEFQIGWAVFCYVSQRSDDCLEVLGLVLVFLGFRRIAYLLLHSGADAERREAVAEVLACCGASWTARPWTRTKKSAPPEADLSKAYLPFYSEPHGPGPSCRQLTRFIQSPSRVVMVMFDE